MHSGLALHLLGFDFPIPGSRRKISAGVLSSASAEFALPRNSLLASLVELFLLLETYGRPVRRAV